MTFYLTIIYGLLIGVDRLFNSDDYSVLCGNPYGLSAILPD